MNNEEPIIRLKLCNFCKTTTFQKFTQIGANKWYLIVRCECPICEYKKNEFYSEKDWEELKGQQILPSN